MGTYFSAQACRSLAYKKTCVIEVSDFLNSETFVVLIEGTTLHQTVRLNVRTVEIHSAATVEFTDLPHRSP